MDNFTFEFFREKLENIERKLDDILNKENTIMSQLDDLNTAIQAEDVEITDLLAVITKVSTDVDALLAKIANGGGSLPDITTQLQAMASHLASLKTGVQQLSDDDTKATA